MVCYYLVILLLLSAQLWFKKLQTLFYKINYSELTRKAEKSLIPLNKGQDITELKPRLTSLVNVILSSAFLSIGGIAMYRSITPAESGKLKIDILAGTSTPVIVVTGDRDDSVVINSGSGFFAARALKNVLLSRSAITVRSAFATGRAVSDGAEGFAILAKQLPVTTIFFPAFSNIKNGILEVKSDDKSYFDYVKAIGVNSDIKMTSGKRRWLKKCGRAYCELRKKCPDNMQFYQAPGELQLSKNVTVDVLTPIYETYPVPLILKIGRKRLLLLGDPSGKSLFSIPHRQLQCDYLVIPIPMISRMKYYKKGLKYILTQIRPEKIIISINGERASESRDKMIDEILKLCSGVEVLRTDRDKVVFDLDL